MLIKPEMLMDFFYMGEPFCLFKVNLVISVLRDYKMMLTLSFHRAILFPFFYSFWWDASNLCLCVTTLFLWLGEIFLSSFSFFLHSFFPFLLLEFREQGPVIGAVLCSLLQFLARKTKGESMENKGILEKLCPNFYYLSYESHL